MTAITINNREYNVIMRHTADQMEQNGYVNTARAMRNNGTAARLFIANTRSQAVFEVFEGVSGRFSKPVSMNMKLSEFLVGSEQAA